MTLLVSIHDVAPATLREVDLLYGLCLRYAVVPALFVVPNWHGCWPIERHRRFLDWLRQRADGGAELFLHGERHDEIETRRTLGDDLRAFGRTHYEAEFLSLSYEAAKAKIDRGLATLRRTGFDPIGFVAPAWLFRPETQRAVGDAGLRISEDDRSIFVHPTRRRIASPAIRWSARTEPRAYASAALAALAPVTARSARTLRIALHPGDVNHWATWRSVERTLEYWTSRRATSGYAAL